MLFVVHCLDHPDRRDDRLAHVEAHRAYLKTAPFTMLSSGPLVSDDDATMLGSLFLVEAPDRAAVEGFFGADPLAKSEVWQAINVHRYRARSGLMAPVEPDTGPCRLDPMIPPDMTPEQSRVRDAIATGPRGDVPVLFWPWLRNPEMADLAQQLGAFVRYRTGLPPRLSELAILITARYWTAQFEWFTHEPVAREAGLPENVIAAIADGREPDIAAPDEALLYRFCQTLHRERRISDALYAEAVDMFGEQTVAELACLLGYYTMAAMTINTFRLPIPDSTPPPLGAAIA